MNSEGFFFATFDQRAAADLPIYAGASTLGPETDASLLRPWFPPPGEPWRGGGRLSGEDSRTANSPTKHLEGF